jgi:8-oxo-dGTP diphosphatase
MTRSVDTDRTYPRHPLLGVGVIVRKDDEVLLVKRGQEPLKGQWTIPGGLVHVGETLQTAAQREIFEECGITIRRLQRFDIFEYIDLDSDKVKFHYIIVEFTADYLNGVLQASSDVIEARWLSPLQLQKFNTTEATKSLILKAFGY